MATTLEALSSRRAFNRFELKYLIAREQIGVVRGDLADRLDPDPHAPDGSYAVWSRYYDTSDLRFYWEKIDGVRFRRKLRIRHYGDPIGISATEPVFVEIKQRINRVLQKRRILIPYGTALALCDGHRLPELEDSMARSLAEEVLGLVTGIHLEATTVVGYQRLAMVGRETDAGLRVTIDSNIRGRHTDLDLAAAVPSDSIVPPDTAILEVKVNERIPFWLTEKIARHELQLVRISKYCQSVEAGPAPALRPLREEIA